MIINGELIYSKLKNFLKLFEKLSLRNIEFSYLPDAKKSYEIIIFGCNRIGSTILQKARKLGKEVLVIDYHPERIQQLIQQKIPCIYGDASDYALLSKINLKNTKIVISTLPDERTNFLITKKIQQANKKITCFVTADQHQHALHLYNSGADYVLMPHHIGGQYIASMLKDIINSKQTIKRIKKEHIQELLKTTHEQH